MQSSHTNKGRAGEDWHPSGMKVWCTPSRKETQITRVLAEGERSMEGDFFLKKHIIHANCRLVTNNRNKSHSSQAYFLGFVFLCVLFINFYFPSLFSYIRNVGNDCLYSQKIQMEEKLRSPRQKWWLMRPWVSSLGRMTASWNICYLYDFVTAKLNIGYEGEDKCWMTEE